MAWQITEKNQLDQSAIGRLGNKFLIGNGYLGYRGTLEEHTKAQKTATIVAGLYDQVGEQWREPVNMPNGCYVQICVEGEELHANFSVIQSHRQTLDMQIGVHERHTIFLAESGNEIAVQARRFASLAFPQLLCLAYTVTAVHPCTLTLFTGIDGEVWDLNGPHLCQIQAGQQDQIIYLNAITHEKRVPLTVAETAVHPATNEKIITDNNRILRQIEVQLLPNQPFTITKYVAHFSGLAEPDGETAAYKLVTQAASLGFEYLLTQQAACWRERWQQCDVQIQGDDEAQLALRFSLYHLLSIAPTHSDKVSIPARGLSGQMYKGAIFWDTEIFMLPFFTYTFPHIARNLLLYRYHTLDGARRKAQAYGYRGAFYAWESQDSGDDACTLFNVTDVFTNRPIRTYFRDKQIHISANIVFAIWHYFIVTQDDTILLDGCAEVICECVRFLLTWLYYNLEKDRYELLDVTGPDEYHERVHNNAYTNMMTAHAFTVCLALYDYLATHYPAEQEALLNKLDFYEDLARIRQVNGRLYTPQPQPQSQIIPQFDGYLSLHDVPLGELLLRKLHPHEYLGGTSGLATTTQIIKQADVVLALCLLPEQASLPVRQANWAYYEPRTEHGSSLSACAYSWLAARLGKVEWAYKYFMKTASIDLQGESKQYVGNLYIGGTHPAANGGAWLSLLYGFCGLQVCEDTLVLEPKLPAKWASVSLPLTFRGQQWLVTVTADEVKIAANGRLLAGVHSFRVGNKLYELEPKQTELTIPLT